MAKQKYDGVIEAVHYAPDGCIEWVRAYERRGPTFSDYVLLPRQALIERLKAGKRILVGKRLIHLASTFEVTQPVHLVQNDGQEVVVVGEAQDSLDHLEGVPVI